MRKILTLFVKYPFYGVMVILIFVILGVLSEQNMKKASMPMMESKDITVSVSYPGATPKEMDEGVTSLIEESIRGVAGIKEFSSQSRSSSATVSVTAYDGYDMDELLIDVKNAVDGISNFPAGAEQPIVSKGRTMDMAMFIRLYSTGDDDIIKLNKKANLIEDDFLGSGYISKISLNGEPSHLELVTYLDETQLRRYDLTFSDVQSAISNNNLDISGGTVKNNREEISVIARNKSLKIDDIKNIVIRGNDDGRVVRVGDVGTVKLTIPESPSGAYVNGKPAIGFRISKLENEDLQAISEYVNKYVTQFNKENNGYQLKVNMDFLDRIDSQLDILIGNGIWGVMLVILMLALLLNFRLSLWVAWGIPSAFLGMFIAANVAGITMNMISLFGMILIIGILVDDGVVIGENVFTHFEMGKSPRRAAIEGTMEVLPAVFTSVITTIIAFLPLMFIEGNMEMMYDMAFVVIACLIVSLMEAVFVLPGHLANSNVLSESNPKTVYGRIRIAFDKGIEYIKQKLYSPALSWIISHKGITVSIAVAMMIITVGLVRGNVINYTLFPKTPSTTFNIDMVLKPGVNEEITKEKIFMIDDKVWEVNNDFMKQFGDTVPYINSTEIHMGRAFSRTESGTHAAEIRVMLNDDLEDSKVTDQMLKTAISKKIGVMPDAYKLAVGASNHFGAPVSISLMGYDEDVLEKAKNNLEDELNKMPALFNVTDNSQIGSEELRLKLKPQAYALGLTTKSLLTEVRQGFYGGLAQRIQDGKEEVWVYVRYSEKDRKTIGQLENMLIHTSKGDYPLSTVATIHKDRSVSTINHFNGKREIRVDAYQKDMNESVPVILNYIEENILSKICDKYPGISYQHQGQQKDVGEQMSSLVLYFGLAFFIIVLIVMIYFKSFNQGFMIIMMIPLGITGAIWGHGIHGEALSMMSIWGMVALSGVIINDAIVFMAKYNQNLEEGMKVKDAVRNAGISRFRAIILTTLTTVAGLMPLILENNNDAAMLIPMAITLAYGIMFGTFFILVLLPALILINNNFMMFTARFKRKYNGKEITPENVEPAVLNREMEKVFEKNMAKKITYHEL